MFETQIQSATICSFGINIIIQLIGINIKNLTCFLKKILFKKYFTSLYNKLSMIDIYIPAWGWVINSLIS